MHIDMPVSVRRNPYYAFVRRWDDVCKESLIVSISAVRYMILMI